MKIVYIFLNVSFRVFKFERKIVYDCRFGLSNTFGQQDQWTKLSYTNKIEMRNCIIKKTHKQLRQKKLPPWWHRIRLCKNKRLLQHVFQIPEDGFFVSLFCSVCFRLPPTSPVRLVAVVWITGGIPNQPVKGLNFQELGLFGSVWLHSIIRWVGF